MKTLKAVIAAIVIIFWIFIIGFLVFDQGVKHGKNKILNDPIDTFRYEPVIVLADTIPMQIDKFHESLYSGYQRSRLSYKGVPIIVYVAMRNGYRDMYIDEIRDTLYFSNVPIQMTEDSVFIPYHVSYPEKFTFNKN